MNYFKIYLQNQFLKTNCASVYRSTNILNLKDRSKGISTKKVSRCVSKALFQRYELEFVDVKL